MFSRLEVEALISADVPIAVSLYLPTHVKGREIRQDPIRLKNLSDEAEEKLIAFGMRRPEARDILAPARDLVGDEGFWRYQDEGLAVFLAPDFSRILKVPIEVPELAVVGDRFHTKPLLPALAFDGRFHVVTITAGRSRLWHGSRYRLAEIDCPQLPQSIAEVQGEIDYQPQWHSAPVARPHAQHSGGVPKTHSFGDDPESIRKTGLIEYLRRIDAALEGFFGDERVPVVLAAESEIQGHFRALSQLRNLLPDGIQANPEAMSPEELHERAYEIVRPRFEEDLRKALAHFRSLKGEGNPKATTKPDVILKGAKESRIEALFLPEGAELWGRVTDRGELTAVHVERQVGDEDLTDVAAAQTLQHGGTIYHVPGQELPPGTTMAAVLRW